MICDKEIACHAGDPCPRRDRCVDPRSGKVSVASCEQNGRTYSLTNPGRRFDVTILNVDGGVIDDDRTKKCDSMFVFDGDGQDGPVVLIELKGTHIETAYAQISETLNVLQGFFRSRKAGVYGRIVFRANRRTPDIKHSPAFIKLHDRLCREYGGDLKRAVDRFDERLEDLRKI